MSNKVSVPHSNNFCPQTMFLYGTYGEDEKPNFGLFCWFSYYWDTELGVMMCIGENKLTKERIKANKVFSANLVTEQLLPLADYFGNTNGYDEKKMDVPVAIERGHTLHVPVLADSPVVYELEAVNSFAFGNSEVFLCKIRNVLMDQSLADESASVENRLRSIAPVSTTCATYFSWDGKRLGSWGDFAGRFQA